MKKENKILTPQLKITGNLMTWDTSALQLSNVSSVSTVPLEISAFPFWAIIVFLAGLFTVDTNKLIGFSLLAFATVAIVSWICEKVQQYNLRNLIIIMNSGINFTFLFDDKKFLANVYHVLLLIIENAGKEDLHVNINIDNSTISGNTNILNDLNIR